MANSLALGGPAEPAAQHPAAGRHAVRPDRHAAAGHPHRQQPDASARQGQGPGPDRGPQPLGGVRGSVAPVVVGGKDRHGHGLPRPEAAGGPRPLAGGRRQGPARGQPDGLARHRLFRRQPGRARHQHRWSDGRRAERLPDPHRARTGGLLRDIGHAEDAPPSRRRGSGSTASDRSSSRSTARAGRAAWRSSTASARQHPGDRGRAARGDEARLRHGPVRVRPQVDPQPDRGGGDRGRSWCRS